MNHNEQIVSNFYMAFQNLDPENMVTHYADDIQFEDPAFGKLENNEAKNMWRMLCKNATNLKITFSILSSEDKIVHAHWDAQYTFSATGRFVKNSIDATFTIENGKIINHLDQFDLWQWSKQAMGIKGWLIGWSPLFKSKLQLTTKKMLHKFGVTH